MRKWLDLDGKLVLQLLTDYAGLTWDELCEATGLSRLTTTSARSASASGRPLLGYSAGAMYLFNCVQSLIEQRLVTIDGVPENQTSHVLRGALEDGEETPKLRTSQQWAKIQMALNMKWLGVPNINSEFSMLVQPFFGAPIALPAQSDVFVLMPFSKSFEPVYTDHIRKVAESLNLSCMRADDLFTSHDLMSDIWSGICGAGVIVADCTGRNPNVFYELGLAHSVGKPVIIITQSAEDIPADIRSIRYIHYSYTPRGMAQFEEVLSKTIHTTMQLNA
ncbi:MAG TPA: hypothetical protein VF263_05675 [Longimicrobiaceae bacterium]